MQVVNLLNPASPVVLWSGLPYGDNPIFVQGGASLFVNEVDLSSQTISPTLRDATTGDLLGSPGDSYYPSYLDEAVTGEGAQERVVLEAYGFFGTRTRLYDVAGVTPVLLFEGPDRGGIPYNLSRDDGGWYEYRTAFVYGETSRLRVFDAAAV